MMENYTNKIALVTGASTGIGKESAIALAKKDYTVYAAARSVDKMQDLKELDIIPIYLDLTQETSMLECVDTIFKKHSRIDILVNNAGYGSYGAIEDVSIAEAKRQYEVNIFGLARMIQLVLPKMRENNFGKIVNVASMGGRIWTLFGAWYHSTKFALEGLSACLRLELKGYNIDVIIIEPGGIETPFGIIAAEHLIETSKGGVYEERAKKTAKGMKKIYSGKAFNKLTKPSVIGKCIAKAVSVRRPKTRYLLGSGSWFMTSFQRIFGDRIYDCFVLKMM
ncbi:MAG: oxidoreductase [Opitutales bacterium]